MKVLFVCTGNTCRSPMAEVLAGKILGGDMQFFSRGLYALNGDAASEYAQQVVKTKGLNLDSHRAKKLTVQDINQADIIITMTGNHKNMILFSFQEAEGKVYTLKEYIGGSGDIMDPFGGDYDLYKATLEELEQAIKSWPGNH